jgi:uncharacterized protein YdaU (DUF1376 family)
MSARWYKRCGADFIHGTMMLTLEEKGAYSLCLDLIYDRGGPIPDDARWLSGVCGVSMRKWSALRDRLVELGKLTAQNGLLSNSRAAFELVSAELSSRKLAEAGAKGGRKRAENQFDYNIISNLAQATLKPKEKIREDKKDPIAHPPKRGTRLNANFVLPDGWKEWARKNRNWSDSDIEAEALLFANYWQAKAGKDGCKLDWFKTWQNWVMVSRRADSKSASPRQLPREEQIARLERSADWFARHDRADDAMDCRNRAERMRGAIPPPGPVADLVSMVGAGMRVGGKNG